MNEDIFNNLLKALPELKEAENKELEDYDLFIDYNEEREEVYLMLWKIVYIFDQKGYRIFQELWRKGCLKPNKDDYLSVKDKEWNELLSVHRYLKINEVEELAKKIGCPIKDVHVHHSDGHKENNCLKNLEPLYKDDHAKRHGFDTWEELLEWRKEN